MDIPTVTILNPNAPSGITTINESDFDPAKHKLAKGSTAPAPAAEPAEAADPAGVTRTDIARMTKADLVDLAEAHGLDASGTVADLREALAAAIFVDA